MADDPHVTRRTYRGTDLEVSFDSDLCIHATECVRRLPAVFDRDRRPWVKADNAPADEVSRVVEHCPTGALQYQRLDGQLGEQPAAATTVTPVEDEPLAIRGDPRRPSRGRNAGEAAAGRPVPMWTVEEQAVLRQQPRQGRIPSARCESSRSSLQRRRPDNRGGDRMTACRPAVALDHGAGRCPQGVDALRLRLPV